METQHQRSRRVLSERKDEICARYLAGESLNDLATDLGVTAMSVAYRLEKNGVPRRAGGPKPAIAGMSSKRRARETKAAHGDSIVSDYAGGMNLEEVASRYGLTTGSVSNYLRAKGQTIRPRGHGSPIHGRGSANPSFRTGSHISDQGYRLVLVDIDDPLRCMAHSKGYVPEHRLVMGHMIGRPLLADETVHHIDGDRLNNAPSNLQLRRGQHSKGVHVRCLDCGSQNVGTVAI